jgi:hemerythrin superfamily protein
MPSIGNERPGLAASVLTDDHSEINTLTGDLLAALDEGDKLKVFARLDLLWARLAVHIRAEHLCLFPSILGADFTIASDGPQYQEVQNAIDQLRLDHEFFMRELGTNVNAIRKQENLSNREVSKQFREIRRSVFEIQSRLAKHNQLEENHVYEWVNILLGETERSALLAG